MTAKARVQSVLAGETVGSKPSMMWPGTPENQAEIWVGTLADSESAGDERVRLIEVTSPFGRGLQRRLDLNAALRQDPQAGSALLDQLTEEAAKEIDSALRSASDGVLYVVYGAEPAHCSPMQYGGYYLDRDLELIHLAAGGSVSAVLVMAGECVYLDFLSEAPAVIFAWDSARSGIGSAQVRQMRAGVQASADPASEVRLVSPGPQTSMNVPKEHFATSL